MNVQASEIRELTADEMNSVTGGYYNVGAWIRAAYAAEAAQAAPVPLCQDPQCSNAGVIVA
jgi:hypothetical protein